MMRNVRKAITMLLTASLAVSCLSISAAATSCDGGKDCPSGRFTDVKPSDWHHEYVDYVAERGLMVGISDTAFGPDVTLSRGMVVTILYSYAGKPDVSGKALTFQDVPAGAYYENPVKWAADHDVVAGRSDTIFDPEADITREELVTILRSFAKSQGVDVSARESLGAYPDADQISEYALENMSWAVAAGLMVGDENGKLNPGAGTTRAEAAVMLMRFIENVLEPAAAPVLSVTSDIFGSGDTGGKTSMKNTLLTASGPGDQRIAYSDPETGERIYYPSDAVIDQPGVTYTGSAVLTLSGDVDDSKIDSSKAVVELVDGDGYYAEELVLAANTLTGTWKNGTLEYTLKEGDLEWYTGDYNLIDDNSGREWSVLGGDGNGVYTFNFKVSGITYNGEPVNDVTFKVQVYIWGRTGTDLAPTITDLVAENNLPSGTSQTSDIQWTWVGEKGDFLGAEAKPVLADDKQDDFFITWPTGTDASGLTAKDVTVTLNTQYGESYVLKSEGEHIQYAVFSDKGETQVAVTFRHAAFTPVFNTMTIEVNNGNGLTASKTYDIASVYAYMVQQGGGGITVDGTVTAYSYYGYEGLTVDNAVQATYTLSYQDEDGTTWYYNQAGGVSQAVEKTSVGFMGEESVTLAAPDDAAVYNAMGEDDCDVQFIVNTLYVKTRLNKTEVKTVDGKEITFTKTYTSGQIGNWDGVSVAPGYLAASGLSPNQQWAWSDYYGSGWSPELYVYPTSIPYTHDGVFGDWADSYVTYYSCSVDRNTTLYLGIREDGWYFLTGVPGSGAVSGTGVLAEKTQGRGPQATTVTAFTFDEAGQKVLDEAGITPWYSYAVLTTGGISNSFSFATDVSEALISDQSAYTIQTVANEDSDTGYTTTITVKDNGYKNVYAYGDWVAVDEDGNEYGPDEWYNGLEYATSSVLPLTKNAEGDWELTVDLASSVMGVIAYHDVWEESLVSLFPQKISFYVPYDPVKQSESTDWTLAFPASETGVEAGTIEYTTTDTGLSVSVYTPAGYSNSGEGYPVVYLIPGGGSNYKSWFTDGMVGNIFDNEIASGEVAPTILVSMQREDVNGDNGSYLESIIAWVEANYNVAEGTENRSLAGVSMGSVAASQIWLNNPTLAQYYAFLSGGDTETFKGAAQEGVEFTYGELDSELLEKMKAATYFLGGGTTDFNMYEGDAGSASVTDIDAWMTHYGIIHNAKGNGSYDITVGDHNWPIWMKLMMTYASDYLWN